MHKESSELSAERFHQLLSPPEYRKLRRKLIRLFAARRCPIPEDLADETIWRVTRKLEAVSADYEGDPMRYFYGVARNVYFEYARRPRPLALDENRDGCRSEENEGADDATYECLERCLEKLKPEERYLISEYYQSDASARRRELAEALGMGVSTLRVRAHRIRRELYGCVSKCLRQSAKFLK